MKSDQDYDYGKKFIEMLEAMDKEISRMLSSEQRELKERIQKLMGDNNDDNE